jgi:hypothetical protein
MKKESVAEPKGITTDSKVRKKGEKARNALTYKLLRESRKAKEKA